MTLVIDDHTWATWESERLELAKVDRARKERQAAIVVFLCALGRWKPDAYRACPQPGSWLADCPACGGARTVAISEFGDHGPVAIWCRTGCSQQLIVDALAAAWRAAEDRDEELEQALELIVYLEERVELLDAVVGRLCDHIAGGGVIT
jgi:hypothetical protein